MSRNKCFRKRTIPVLVSAALVSGSGAIFAQTAAPTGGTQRLNTITPQDRQAAAKRAAAKGFKPAPIGALKATATGGTTTGPGTGTTGPGAGTTGPGGTYTPGPGVLTPGAVPHYFSMSNYANSPLRVPVATVTVNGAGMGAVVAATAADPLTGALTGFTVLSPGSGYAAGATLTIVNYFTKATDTATAIVDPASGGITGVTVPAGGIGSGYLSPGIRKFVDTLPGLDAVGANNLGNYIPVAKADTSTYPGSDYYEIELGEYTQQLHSDLPPTRLRGYRQVNTTDATVSQFHYLGPVIIGAKDRPVRIKFINKLPGGAGGNLFVPVDTTVMGSGEGPEYVMAPTFDPQNPDCGGTTKAKGCYTENRATLHLHGGVNPWISDGTTHQWITPASETGVSASYDKGASARNVPDMKTATGAVDCDSAHSGCQTFYWPNQQGSRMMFYHDHAHGITRLNVYVGEAAGYLVTDKVEQDLINGTNLTGVNPTGAKVLPDVGIPLVFQDKTFVPDDWQLSAQDNTWNKARWGGLGGLWLPHVYSPAQNPGDLSGVNQFGRWAYGPWFWPPTTGIAHGPIANPYYDINCPDGSWCEPVLMPGVPNVSMGMEAFHDTPLVNGAAYPTVEVEPRAYRFRMLNAANDRFFSLSLYQAVDANGLPCNGAGEVAESTGITCTEVALNAAEVAAALANPAGVFPTPDITKSAPGPNWIQIGTEGGLLPAPVVIAPQVTTWVTDPTVFNAGNVDKHGLLLGPAERADVVVDFSAYAGKTLIVYNDAPAAFPARDPRYDYYTGNADLVDTGGAPSTPRGYGPNTRTVMRIKVKAGTGVAYDVAALQNVFTHQAATATATAKPGVFETAQPPILVGQDAYDSAYGTNFRLNPPENGLVQIFDTSLTFRSLAGTPGNYSLSANLFQTALQPKMIQDEMGEAFEKKYGRMSGNLGVETPNAAAGAQNMILYAFPHPPTEVIDGTLLPVGNAMVGPLPKGVQISPATGTSSEIDGLGDGTQIWKITHNGVDTHPIHFHLYDVQLLNRVGWDGIIRKPDANELGWKDTVRISPLEDTIVALRPVLPTAPFDLPNSVRLLDPTMPIGAPLPPAFVPAGVPVTSIVNKYVNFGLEYVWHCHILSHEEMDMMRPQVVGMTPNAPTGLTATANGTTVNLSWTDNSAGETEFVVERSEDNGVTYTPLASLVSGQNGQPDASLKGARTLTDSTVKAGNTYQYRVYARNLVGDTQQYVDPNGANPLTFPFLDLKSASVASAPVTVQGGATAMAGAPTNLTATLATGTRNAPQVTVRWLDNTAAEAGFVLEYSTDGGATFGNATTVGPRTGTGTTVSYLFAAAQPGVNYAFRVKAVGSQPGQATAWSNVATLSVPPLPVAPSNASVTAIVTSATTAEATVRWMDNSQSETGFQVQRAQDAAFTQGLNTNTVGANTTIRVVSNLTRGRNYYFRVRALSNVGPSAWVNATPFPMLMP